MQNKIPQFKIDAIISSGFDTGFRYGEKTKIAREIGVHRSTIWRRWRHINNSF